jgi:hypothetical protein
MPDLPTGAPILPARLGRLRTRLTNLRTSLASPSWPPAGEAVEQYERDWIR